MAEKKPKSKPAPKPVPPDRLSRFGDVGMPELFTFTPPKDKDKPEDEEPEG